MSYQNNWINSLTYIHYYSYILNVEECSILTHAEIHQNKWKKVKKSLDFVIYPVYIMVLVETILLKIDDRHRIDGCWWRINHPLSPSGTSRLKELIIQVGRLRSCGVRLPTYSLRNKWVWHYDTKIYLNCPTQSRDKSENGLRALRPPKIF